MQGVELRRQPLPVVLGVRGRPALRFLVGVRAAPAFLGLRGIRVGVEVPEDLELLLRCEPYVHPACLHRVFDGGGHLLESADPSGQQVVLAPQVFLRVGVRVVQEGRDLFERKAELPVEQDLLEPVQVVLAVTPVTCVAALAGEQQSDLVVVVQGAHRHPGEGGDLPYRIAHFRSLLGTRSTMCPHVT